MSSARSYYAFRLSAEKLFEVEPKLYFWTFTFRDVLPDWCYSRSWGRFMASLSELYGGTLRGLRVLEFHRAHGAHYHALLNKRVGVGEVRRLGKRVGIGRVHVTKAQDVGVVNYLGKYLSKSFASQNQAFARLSRWGTIGAFQGVKVSDVEVVSNFHRACGAVRVGVGSVRWPGIARQVVDGLRGVPYWDSDVVCGVVLLLQSLSPPEVFSMSSRLLEREGVIHRQSQLRKDSV